MAHDMAPEYAPRLDIKALAIARRSTDVRAWEIMDVRPMTKEDLASVASHPASPDPRAPLARISAPHHMLARLVAEGKSNIEVSGITGYTPARISTLKSDPAFCELVAHYEGEVIQAEADIHAQITHVALTAKQLLLERLEDTPEDFSNKDLQALMALGLDRIGHGPGSKVDLNLNDPARVIENLRSVLQSQGGRVISKSEIIDAEVIIVEPADDPPAPSPGIEEG